MTTAASASFVRTAMVAPQAPPLAQGGILTAIRERLFGGIGNSILTVLGVALLAAIVWPVVKFLFIDAV